MCHVRAPIFLVAVLILLLSGPRLAYADKKSQKDLLALCMRHESVWTPTEQYLWGEVCATGKGSGKDVPARYAPSVPRQPIHAAFLKTLLTEKPYRDRIAEVGLELDSVNITEPLVLQSPKLNADIAMRDFTAMDIALLSGKLDGSLTLTNANLQALMLVNMHITGDLAITKVQFGRQNPCAPHGDQAFDGTMAQVDGVSSVVESHASELNFPAARFGRELFIQGSDANSLNLSSSHIAGNATLVNNRIYAGWQVPCDLSSDPSYLMRPALNMDGAVASSNVALTKTDIRGPATLSGAAIDGSLVLTAARFHSVVDLSDARIARKLVMDEAVVQTKDAKLEPVHWEQDSVLMLRDATIGTIAARQSENIWPEKLDLLNLNFASYSGQSAGSAPYQEPERWFPAWLAKSSGGYNAQTYERVRLYLLSIGEVGAATKVGFVGKWLELKDSWRSGFWAKSAFLLASGATTGFGFYPWFAAVWTLAFVLLGAFVFRRTQESLDAHMPHGYAFSFDTFLPLIKLRERHYEIDIKGKARYYFYVHKLAGWVLGSFLVAAISGLTK